MKIHYENKAEKTKRKKNGVRKRRKQRASKRYRPNRTLNQDDDTPRTHTIRTVAVHTTSLYLKHNVRCQTKEFYFYSHIIPIANEKAKKNSSNYYKRLETTQPTSQPANNQPICTTYAQMYTGVYDTYGEYMWKIDSIEIKIKKEHFDTKYIVGTSMIHTQKSNTRRTRRKEETHMHALNSPFGSFLLMCTPERNII